MMRQTINRISGVRVLALGALLAVLVAFMILAAQPAHASTTFTVNSTADNADALLTGGVCDTGYKVEVPGGAKVAECTLRAAIQQANYTTGADTINFAIPTTGVATIAPESQLPKITGPLSINGYSQPGASANTKAVGSDAVLKIHLSGAKTSVTDALVIGSSNSTVKGLVINGWQGKGVMIDGAGANGNRISGNFIGTDASGSTIPGNYVGVRVRDGSDNTIGGTTAAARNLISGNSDGVYIGDGGVTKRNKVVGNYIGTDATGTKDLGNVYDGVGIKDGGTTTDTMIGGATAAERNVISGNDDRGVAIFGSGNKVAGNFIGTDATGTKALGNDDTGVYVSGTNNSLGGTQPGERNVISANDDAGVTIYGVSSTGNKVTGNYIGTDKGGAAPLGNSNVGVSVSSAPLNTIGGTSAGARNVISANGVDGVYVTGDDATGNRILSNSIFANVEHGIDLGTNGSTANDLKDADTGPNYLQNKPLLSSAKKSATGTTTVRGTLNSTPGKTFTVQFFSNPSGTDEGKTLLGTKSVTTNGNGNVSFAFSTKKAIRLGQNITATATNTSTGDTSEFSAPRKVVAQ